jgi:hypothetical protein
MFSRFAKLFDAARGSTSALARALRQVLGNREATLEHEGKVVLSRGPSSTGDSEWLELNVQAGAEARFRGNNLGVFKWAIVVEEHRHVANRYTQKNEFWIRCKDCDRDGQNMVGPAVDVRLIVTGANYPDIDIGDIVGYFFDPDRIRITFPCFQAVHYGYPIPDEDPTLLSADDLVLIA